MGGLQGKEHMSRSAFIPSASPARSSARSSATAKTSSRPPRPKSRAAGSAPILYLRQEGRGIGLANKIRAYALQAHGADTVDANRLLGLPDDARRYDAAAAMLAELGVISVELLTNNPAKEEALRASASTWSSASRCSCRPTRISATYLETKRSRMRHAIPALGRDTADGPILTPLARASNDGK